MPTDENGKLIFDKVDLRATWEVSTWKSEQKGRIKREHYIKIQLKSMGYASLDVKFMPFVVVTVLQLLGRKTTVECHRKKQKELGQ